MTVRPDNRLADAPMHPVSCRACGAAVLARKSSWQQTSVQWSQPAMAACRSWDPGDPFQGRHPVCEELRASIAQAATDGTIPVLECEG
ncbi:ferredoxin [Nocardioides sp. NPDC057577]|uniref:ferredoxin n=1 Tax=Nocardioides sp. NPDC057577 TaxID=3346171 RepID=UPI00366CD40B